MTYLTYFAPFMLPHQRIASRGLPQPVFHQAQGKVVYWLTASAEARPVRPLQAMPGAWVTYRLLPAALAADPDRSAPPASSRATDLTPRELPAEQRRNYILDYQQAAYDELAAGSQLAPESPSLMQRLPPLSLAEITRDLAGWTVPPTEVQPERPRKAAPKPRQGTAVKRRHAQYPTN